MKSKGCRIKRISISAYLDDELRPRKRVKIEAHLRVCRACSEYLAELRAVSERVKMLPRVEPSHETVVELKRAVRLPPMGKQKRFAPVFSFGYPRWAFAAAAASVVIIAAVLFSVIPGGQRPELANNLSGEAILSAKSLGEVSADRADSDLEQAKQRMLAELTWDTASEDGAPDSERGLRPFAASYERSDDTRGRVVHSVDFGSTLVRRPPVSSHVLYVSYGN